MLILEVFLGKGSGKKPLPYQRAITAEAGKEARAMLVREELKHTGGNREKKTVGKKQRFGARRMLTNADSTATVTACGVQECSLYELKSLRLVL